MKLSLIGCGCGRGSLTAEAAEAIGNAEILIGAPRLLEMFPEKKNRIRAMTAEEIENAARESGAQNIGVLFSGDSGFFSGARLLVPLLEDGTWELFPGISSLQMLASRLGEPWQDWRLCSAHGTSCDAVAEVCRGRKTFFLTGGKLGPGEICRDLTASGLGFLKTTVGEYLGTDREQLRCGTAEEFAEEPFEKLSVLLTEAAPRYARRVPGIPDSLFAREEKVPMTKQEVRAAALALMEIGPEDCCWDIGAGTGSVSVELALQAKSVWGVEQREDALRTAELNRRQFGAWNLRLVRGCAPEILEGLPAPDAVFLGGSGGRMTEIIAAVHGANPAARICISAIALESLHCAVETFRRYGYEPDVRQIAVSRNRKTGGLNLMLAQNPVYLILGKAE